MSDTHTGVNTHILQEIIEIVTSHKPVEKIVLYGSRATNHFKRTSDIDLAIFDPEWSAKDISLVHFKLEEDIQTPLKFDLLNFYDLKKENLKKDILSEGIVIYESKKN